MKRKIVNTEIVGIANLYIVDGDVLTHLYFKNVFDEMEELYDIPINALFDISQMQRIFSNYGVEILQVDEYVKFIAKEIQCAGVIDFSNSSVGHA